MNAGRAVIVAGCIYEVAAICTRKVPTITDVVKHVGTAPRVGRFLLWMWLGFIVDHFIERNTT